MRISLLRFCLLHTVSPTAEHGNCYVII